MTLSRAAQLRIATAGLAGLAAIASAPLAISALGEQGIVTPAFAAAQRVMSVFEARSPGERPEGATFQTKNKKKYRVLSDRDEVAPAASPAEQLAQAVIPAPAAPVDVAPPVVGPAVPPAAAIVAPTLASRAATAFGAVPLAVGAAIIAGGSPPSSGGSGGTPPGSVPPTTTVPPTTIVPPVTSAVPEPQSWLLMLLGFGAIGSGLRRRAARPLARA